MIWVLNVSCYVGPHVFLFIIIIVNYYFFISEIYKLYECQSYCTYCKFIELSFYFSIFVDRLVVKMDGFFVYWEIFGIIKNVYAAALSIFLWNLYIIQLK